MFKQAIGFALLVASGMGFAGTAPPVDGIYWDPSQSGRGYAVETQDDNVFVAIYNYGQDSSPIFYSVQGKWDSSGRKIRDAQLFEVSSGPWIGGPFSAVGQVVSRGPVTFEFPTFTTARFKFNGQTSHLTRFLYGYAPQANSLMRGAWHATYGSTLAFGDFIFITGNCTSCADLPEPFIGYLTTPSHMLVGSRLPDGTVIMLADSSTSYYSLYVFDLRVNDWAGWEATFLKTQTTYPTSGLPLFGHRLAGPAMLKSAPLGAASSEESEQLAAMKAQASLQAASSSAEKSAALDLDAARAVLPALASVLERLR